MSTRSKTENILHASTTGVCLLKHRRQKEQSEILLPFSIEPEVVPYWRLKLDNFFFCTLCDLVKKKKNVQKIINYK